jgi:hypothetical protein
MKRSSAATTAAASSGETPGATILSLGRRFTIAVEGIVRGPWRGYRSWITMRF